MKVVQLIDSLNPGGAERMAVTFANSLDRELEGSYLAVTREEGAFKQEIANPEHYIFLNRKSILDLAAARRFKRFLKIHGITIIHAHTTSFFFAVLTKLLYPKVRIVWHEHLGKRLETTGKENKALRWCSRYFSEIITVNEALKTWCEKNLKTSKVTYLPNFVTMGERQSDHSERSSIIMCLANLKAPKNHLNLLQAFSKLNKEFPRWKLQLIGADYQDAYSEEIKDFIRDNGMEDAVELLGLQSDTKNLLEQAKIGVLSSDHEGLPMALLEYGAAGIAALTTKVGRCEEVISTFGTTVPPGDPDAFANGLRSYMKNESLLAQHASQFRKHVEAQYSEKTVLPQLMNIYKRLV